MEFGVEIGQYQGVLRVPRRVFQRLLLKRPTPEWRVAAYYLQRTRLESIGEERVSARGDPAPVAAPSEVLGHHQGTACNSKSLLASA